jgi:hypothetical protein
MMRLFKFHIAFSIFTCILILISSIFIIPERLYENDLTIIDHEDTIDSTSRISHNSRSKRDIWVDSFKINTMIDEMENVELKNENIELTKNDFIYSSTGDFENGTKSLSNGNFEIETNVDNPGIQKNNLELSNGKGDRFNVDDSDGDTWKWDAQDVINTGGSVGSFLETISNGQLNLKINNGNKASCGAVSNFRLNKNNDFEIKTKVDITKQSISSYHSFGIWDVPYIKEFTSSPNGVKIIYYGNLGQIIVNKFISGVKSQVVQKTIGTKTLIYYKIQYVKNSNTFTLSYGFDDNSWTQATSINDVTFDSNPYIIYILTNGGSTGSPEGKYDDFTLVNGKLVNGYRTYGVWESTPIELENKYALTDTSIDFSDTIPVMSKIDSIQWLENDIVKASYDTDIVDSSKSPFTISEADLTTGSFNEIINDFTIKLRLVGDGNNSPIIRKLTGNLRSLSGHIISTPVELNQNYCWDELKISKTNTTETDIEVSVLDGITGNFISGFENLTNIYINLSNLDSKTYPIIKLRADFFGSSSFSPILHEWSVSWIEDYPVMVPEIPSTYSISEDSNVVHLIDLSEYFYDYYDPVDNLNFRLIHQSNKKHLEAQVDGYYLDFYTKLKDWSGTETFQVECLDTGGLQSNSNKFEITVTPVNDPPFWDEIIPDVKLDEDTSKEAWLDLDNYASDIEEDFLDYKLVVQSDPVNISININAENKLTIIPKHNYFGTSNATIQVFESGNKNFYTNDTFNITVLPINDPPMITSISDQTIDEDQWLNLTIMTSDPDFDTNFTFKSNISNPNFNIEQYNGKLSFHPTNDDVGILFVNVTVEDMDGLKGYDEFGITVKNVNDPPDHPIIATPDDDAKFKTNELVEFQAGICEDIDIGDIITYSWDFDFSNGIQQEKLGRVVNHSYKTAGIYKVTLTISDGTVQKSTFVLANITKSDTGTNGGGETNGKGSKIDNFSIAIIVIIIIAVLALIISSFMLSRKKRKSILNKYIDEIDQAYDWARTNPTVGKEKLSNLKIKLSGDLKEGRLDTQSYNLLENKLNDYMHLLGMRVAGAPPGQIPTAQPYKVTPVAEPKQIQISQPSPSSPQPKVGPVQPAPSPQIQPSTSQTIQQSTQQPLPQKKQVVKCFNCGNLVTVTLAPEGEPTIMHCPKCGQTGTL